MLYYAGSLSLVPQGQRHRTCLSPVPDIYSNSLVSKDYSDILDLPLGFRLGDKLEELEIGDEVTSIGAHAFFDLGTLKKLTIGKSVNSIGENAFYQCYNIRTLIVNSNSLLSQNYTESTSLYNVLGNELNFITIGEGVENIGDYAFSGCRELLTLSLPESIVTIGNGAFYDCGFLQSLVIPNSVTIIGAKAFDGCFCIKSLSLGNSLETIGNCAFYCPHMLTSLIIPNSVKKIGTAAFGGSASLMTLVIGNSVESIEESTFALSSAMTTLTIGSSVKSIGPSAFAECSNLKTVNCYASEPPTCDMFCFFNTPIKTSTLYVPAKSLSSYNDKSPWKSFAKILPLSDDTAVESIYRKDLKIKDVYTQNGQHLPTPRKGLNIIRTNDGKIRKVVVK